MNTLCRIREVSRAIAEFEQCFEREYRLSMNEGVLLCCLARHGELSSGEIAEMLRLTCSNTSKVIRSAEGKGFVNKRKERVGLKFRPSLLFGTCVSMQKRSGGVKSVSSGCASCVSGHCVKCFSGNASRFSSCHSPFAAASGGYPLHAAIFLPASPAMSKWRHRIGEIFFREACSLILRAAAKRYFCFIRFLRWCSRRA